MATRITHSTCNTSRVEAFYKTSKCPTPCTVTLDYINRLHILKAASRKSIFVPHSTHGGTSNSADTPHTPRTVAQAGLHHTPRTVAQAGLTHTPRTVAQADRSHTPRTGTQACLPLTPRTVGQADRSHTPCTGTQADRSHTPRKLTQADNAPNSMHSATGRQVPHSTHSATGRQVPHSTHSATGRQVPHSHTVALALVRMPHTPCTEAILAYFQASSHTLQTQCQYWHKWTHTPRTVTQVTISKGAYRQAIPTHSTHNGTGTTIAKRILLLLRKCMPVLIVIVKTGHKR